MSESATYEDAPTPLTERERILLKRMFSDFFLVPGEWKTALKAELERDPPVLGKYTLGGQSAPPEVGSVTTAAIADGTIQAEDINPLYIDGPQTTPSLRTLGTGHQQAAPGDDPRFGTGGSGGTPGPNTVTSVMIVDGTITDVDVNAANKDGAAGTPSLRTLGTGAQQAAAGNDARFFTIASGVGSGDIVRAGGRVGDNNFVHVQSAISAVWTVIHNMGKFPAVDVVDTGDSVILPNIHYDSANQLTLTFAAATSGKAYVN